MADFPIPAKPPSGLTFRIAVWVLGGLLLAEMASIGWSLATRSVPGAPPRIPGKAEMVRVEGGGSGGLDEADLAAQERALVDAMGQGERIGVGSGAPGVPEIPAVPPVRRPSDILDDGARELYEVGRALRADGEMMGALDKFRAADARLPGNPRILYEIASAYATMGLAEKAAPYWIQIRDLGAEGAGDVYAIADLKLMGEPEAPPMRPLTVLYVNQALIKEHPEITTGEQVTIRLALKARDGVPIDVDNVYLDARFYDITTGGTVEASPSNPVRWEWMTQPADWKDQPEEVLDLVYYRASERDFEGVAVMNHRYYGFLVKLYYQDVLQDIYSEPRTLVDEITRFSGGTSGGESLFPQD
jgi:hypothetical protein